MIIRFGIALFLTAAIVFGVQAPQNEHERYVLNRENETRELSIADAAERQRELIRGIHRIEAKDGIARYDISVLRFLLEKRKNDNAALRDAIEVQENKIGEYEEEMDQLAAEYGESP